MPAAPSAKASGDLTSVTATRSLANPSRMVSALGAMQVAIITHAVGTDGLKDCFREPIPEIFEAARLLESAVNAHLLGNRAAAEQALRAADMPVIGEWLDSVWLGPWTAPYRALRKVPGLPPVLPKADRSAPRDATRAMKRALVARDGHHCRLCGIPLVRAEVRKKLTQLYPEAARWTGERASEQHRGLQVMWLQYDHVIVHSRGGETSMDNLVVTCPGCNYGRDRFTLEEVGLRDPRTHIRKPYWDGWRTWQGLEQILPARDRFLSDELSGKHGRGPLAINELPDQRSPPTKAGTNKPKLETQSDDEFFARLATRRPNVVEPLKAFLREVQRIGVSPQIGKTAKLLLSAGGQFSAGIIDINGQFWASGVWAAANRAGRADAAERYMQSVSAIIGGSVRRYAKAGPEVLDAAGHGADVLLLLQRASDWKQAIETLAKELLEAVPGARS